jgi:hypothetical protein
MQKEAKMLLRIKRIIDDTARLESPIAMLRQKIMLEDSFGRMLRMKDISGRGFGIIKRHLDKKIPKEKYCDYGHEIRKRARPSNHNEGLTEKELEKIIASSNGGF